MYMRWLLLSIIGIANAVCPYMSRDVDPGLYSSVDNPHSLHARDQSGDAASDTEEFLSQFYLNDTDAFMTTDVGGPISDQASLKAGERGPTLLEDFIFRQKIQRFDHERVRQ
jgi:catalase